LLLAGNFGFEFGFLFFQQPQPANIRPIGCAHEVRQHVDFSKDVSQQLFCRCWMGQTSPVRVRYLAALHGLLSKGTYLFRRFCLGELID
jgi:hypothetical protein